MHQALRTTWDMVPVLPWPTATYGRRTPYVRDYTQLFILCQVNDQKSCCAPGCGPGAMLLLSQQAYPTTCSCTSALLDSYAGCQGALPYAQKLRPDDNHHTARDKQLNLLSLTAGVAVSACPRGSWSPARWHHAPAARGLASCLPQLHCCTSPLPQTHHGCAHCADRLETQQQQGNESRDK